MRQILLIATMALSLASAHAQTATNSGAINTGADPLSVGTSTMPASPVISGSPASESGVVISERAGGSAAGISTSSSNTSQVPLQLPGEKSGTSTQSATSTAAAAAVASGGATCPPPVPTTDGGSANLTEMVGAPLGGC